MIEISCNNCGQRAFGYEDGKIITFPSGGCEGHVAALELVFEAIKQGQGKGMKLLRDFVDENHCIFG